MLSKDKESSEIEEENKSIGEEQKIIEILKDFKYYEKPKKENISHTFKQLIYNLKIYKRIEL